MNFPGLREFIDGPETVPFDSENCGECFGVETQCDETFLSSGKHWLDERCSYSDEPLAGVFESFCESSNNGGAFEDESSPIVVCGDSCEDENNSICEDRNGLVCEGSESSPSESCGGGESNMNGCSSPCNNLINQYPAFQPIQPAVTLNSFPVFCGNQIPSPFRTNLFPVVSPRLFSSSFSCFPAGGTTCSRVFQTSPAGASFSGSFTADMQRLPGRKAWNEKKCAQTGFVTTEYLKKLCKFNECLSIFICYSLFIICFYWFG
jgi:hypothetical protein